MRELAHFEVAGESHYKRTIASLGTKKPDYNLTPQEMLRKYGAGESVFQYSFKKMAAEVVPEPTNPHDRNALKIMIGGKHVGYIPRELTSEACRYLSKSNAHWTAEISWGPFRRVKERGPSISLESKDYDFSIQLSVWSTQDEEEYEVKCRKHWISFVLPGIISFFLLLTGIKDVVDGNGFSSFFVALLFSAIILGPTIVRYFTDYIAIDGNKLIGHIGFIRSKTISTPLSRVQDATYSNGLLGKILGYHTVTISSAGTGGTEYVFKRMAHGDDFVDELNDQI